MSTIPDSMLIGISTVHRRDGLLYSKFRASYGQNDDDVLFIKATSRAAQPYVDQAIIDAAISRDGPAGRAEYLSEWRDDLAQFLSRELIELAVDRGVLVRPRIPGVTYRGFMDPSGGVSDASPAPWPMPRATPSSSTACSKSPRRSIRRPLCATSPRHWRPMG